MNNLINKTKLIQDLLNVKLMKYNLIFLWTKDK